MFDAIGGAESVRVAVDRFYQAVLGDETLSHYFAGVDLGRLKRHQALLITQLLGGPQEYDGRSLGEAHGGLGITGPDFERVGEHLLGTLAGLGVGDDVLAAMSGTLGAVRGDIVTADAAAAPYGGAPDGVASADAPGAASD
jgi:hemoglobin